MKKLVLVGALTLLAACGSSNNGVSVATSGDKTTTPAAAGSSATDAASASTTADGTVADDTSDSTGDTINVDNFGDMPPQCIELLSTFLKAIEPTVSKIDWKTATLSDFEALGQQFQDESDTFDTQSSAEGCNKYNLTGSDAEQLTQVVELASKEAPGTVGFLTFLGSLSTDSGATGASVPADCEGTLAAIEAYMAKGGTMKDMTMTDLTAFGKLMTAVNTNCTPEQAQAFAARDDVKAFISG